MINFGRYNLLATAAQPLTAAPALWHATTTDHLAVLAKAYAWRERGRDADRDAVIEACAAVIGTEIDPATTLRASSLAIARQLMAYVTAAEIVGLPEPGRTTFRTWLASTITVNNSENRSLVTSNSRQPSEWGTFAGAALIAAYRYLGDAAGIATVANILRGFLGDRAAYAGFSYSSAATLWFPDGNAKVGVLPVGATLVIGGTARDLDGCIPNGMRFETVAYPFPVTDAPYTALQGVIAQAVQLAAIAGYETVWEWSDQAIRRAFRWQLEAAGAPAEGDDAGMLHVVNAIYGLDYPAPAMAQPGKLDAFYDWRYGPLVPFTAPDWTYLNRGLWVSRSRLPALSQSGPAWDAMLARAVVDPWPAPALWNQDSNSEQSAVAGALVAVATADTALRDRVIAWCLSCIGSEITPATSLRSTSLALSRNLFGVLVAADLVQMKDYLSTEQRASFDDWVKSYIYSINSEGRSIFISQYQQANGWGTKATATLLAAYWWLDEPDGFAAVAAIFKGWLGDRATYAGFSYSYDLSWQADPSAPVGINPKDSVLLWDNPYVPEMASHYVSVDGVLPEQMRRWDGVSFIFPAPREPYCWEGLQAAMASAEILTRAGYPAWTWEDEAIVRAVRWLYTYPVSFNNTVWLMGSADYPPAVFTNYDDAAARGQPVTLRYRDPDGAEVTATLTLSATDSSLRVTGVVPCRELLAVELGWSAASDTRKLLVYAGPIECATISAPLVSGVHTALTGYPAQGDDAWLLWLLNARLGGSVYPTATPTTPGKQIGFTDWTHEGVVAGVRAPDAPGQAGEWYLAGGYLHLCVAAARWCRLAVESTWTDGPWPADAAERPGDAVWVAPYWYRKVADDAWVRAVMETQFTARPPSRSDLPDAATLPDGATLQVTGGVWAVETATGWVPAGGLPAGADGLPDPAALPDGSTLQVMSGVWMVETLTGWVPTAGLPPNSSGLPDPAARPDGATLQVMGGVWIA